VPELLVTALGLALFGGMALAVAALPAFSLLWASAAISGIGCLLGIPGGIAYHLTLRRELLRQGSLPRGWLWHPTRLHDQLDDDANGRIRPWFLVGALGFMLIMSGAMLATVTLVTHF
jgi:hypothetical protein